MLNRNFFSLQFNYLTIDIHRSIHVDTLFVPDIINNNGRHLPPPPTHFLILFVHFFVFVIVAYDY